MRNYVKYYKVECFTCKKSFSRQIVARKKQADLVLNRNQHCVPCWQEMESNKIPIIQLSKVTGFITIKIFNSFSIKDILKENNYEFIRDVKGNPYWQKLLQSPTFDDNPLLILSPSKQKSWLNNLNKQLLELLSLEKSFFLNDLPKPWQIHPDPESQKLFALDLS